jgi:adenylate cyclase
MKVNEMGRSWLRILLSIPLRLKITIPYLVVASLLAGLASYQVAHTFVMTLEERFRAQLQDASYRVAEGLLGVEENHLAGLRTIAFTLGVPEAVKSGDINSLMDLIYPQIVNNQLYYVDLLDEDGNPLITWHREGETLDYINNQTTDYSNWSSVQAVLSGQVDDLGDKYAEIVSPRWGQSIYTAGPIILNGDTVGVLLIGTPVSKLVPELAINSLSNVTVYDSKGFRTKSTFENNEPIPVVGEAILENLASDSIVTYTRSFGSGTREYIEAVDNVYLRGVPSGWYYGVALPTSLVQDAGVPALLPLIAIFVIGVVVLIALGAVVAQLIAVPVFRLLNASERVGSGDFETQVDVYADDEIGMLTDSFNQMVQELQQREFVREMFGRMVSQDVSEAILMGGLALGGETRFVSVLFTDVRGFTSMSEKFPPDDVINLLNQFFGIITQATRKNQGVINHFGGDSVLAVFGAPIERPPEETLWQVISTALDIRRGMVELNAERISKGLEPLRYGVGINSGEVIAGKIGTEDRFHYTVIGDVVNVAARLQGISRQFPRTPLLIPDDGMHSVKENSLFEFQYLGEFRLKGKEKAVPTYAVVGDETSYPAEFTAYDDFPYPKTEAFLACYLYCLGYSLEVIGKTLQINVEMVGRWIDIAAENFEIVSDVLSNLYGLSPDWLSYLRQDELSLVKEA